ncbi:MAG: hypothetical protein GX556_12385 [Fibrobacter sp.]|nr:hypothetical protein [Fibrobacter sp.]
MKHVVVLIISLFLAGCGLEFPDRYDRVDNDRVRPLVFVYDNKGLAEGAPGDTVTLHAYFAGEPARNIQWTILPAMLVRAFGVDAYRDTIPLQSIVVAESYAQYSGGLTDSAVISLMIPRDIIRNEFANVSTIGSLLPLQVRESVPDKLLNVSPVKVIDMLDFLASRPPGVDSSVVDSALKALAGENASDHIPFLLQALSVTMKVLSTVNDKYKVESLFTIRYNSAVSYLNSTVPVNRNPVIEWSRLYKVKGTSVNSFDPAKNASLVDQVYSMDEVYRDTVVIEDGYSYFLAADSGTHSLDYGMSMNSGQMSQESFIYEWFYRNDDFLESADPEKLIVLEKSPGSKFVKLLPPIDRRMKHFSLWLVTYDTFMGERLRPVGFCFRAMHGVIAYR